MSPKGEVARRIGRPHELVSIERRYILCHVRGRQAVRYGREQAYGKPCRDIRHDKRYYGKNHHYSS
jgi:hypothetical protein